ncbi:MAG: hypothetical protein IT546_02750 [Caulobacteraceae bacterium]|nr:hypothetical protein [Caulobacteraceae bacterium]
MSSNPVKRSTDPEEAEVDAYIARNRDALNASIRRSRREVAEGIGDPRSIDEIITDGRNRRGGA